MDIQQICTNIQNNPKNKISQLASLGSIAEYALNALEAEQPTYFYKHERKFEDAIHNYTDSVIQICQNGTDQKTEMATEDLCSGVLDASCALSREHFKAGFQFGALLIMNLLH